MNHAFVIVPGTISEDRFDVVLREIVRERWGDLVPVVRVESAWTVSYGTDSRFSLTLWLRNPRRIEMRKQLGDLSSWLQTFVQESLAAKLNGKCADEGTPGRHWEGKPDDFRTFRQWWDEIYSHSGAFIFKSIYKRLTAGMPKELLCTDESRSAPVSKP